MLAWLAADRTGVLLFDGYFPSSGALLKALYLSTHQLTQKLTLPLRNWGVVHAELAIMYPGRLSES